MAATAAATATWMWIVRNVNCPSHAGMSAKRTAPAKQVAGLSRSTRSRARKATAFMPSTSACRRWYQAKESRSRRYATACGATVSGRIDWDASTGASAGVQNTGPTWSKRSCTPHSSTSPTSSTPNTRCAITGMQNPSTHGRPRHASVRRSRSRHRGSVRRVVRRSAEPSASRTEVGAGAITAPCSSRACSSSTRRRWAPLAGGGGGRHRMQPAGRSSTAPERH